MSCSSDSPDESPAEDPVALLKRWEQFGATWQILSRSGQKVTISMCRCDGGEEVQRLVSDDPGLLSFLDGREHEGS